MPFGTDRFSILPMEARAARKVLCQILRNQDDRVPGAARPDAMCLGLIRMRLETRAHHDRMSGGRSQPTASYRPAPAAAAAGIMPAIFMPSMRVSTASMLDPVSMQAST
jgi:hypothetical protein